MATLEGGGRREFLIGKGWIQTAVLVVLFGFFVLGLLAYRTYMAHPERRPVVRAWVARLTG